MGDAGSTSTRGFAGRQTSSSRRRAHHVGRFVSMLGPSPSPEVSASRSGGRRGSSRCAGNARGHYDSGTNRTASFALSPDGRLIVFSGEGSRGPQLWIRSLDAPSSRPLSGTEAAVYPFWSPDSRSIGFFANSRLKRRISTAAGANARERDYPAGGTWNRDGTILYVPNDSGGIFRVSDKGGDASRVTPRRSPGLATRLPYFLPDGRHFLFFVAQRQRTRVCTSARWETIRCGGSSRQTTPAVYSSGYLFFVRESSLFAQSFDPSTQELRGPATRVGDDIAFGLDVPPISTSAAGVIAYRTGAGQSTSRLVWLDRSGKQVGRAGRRTARVQPVSVPRRPPRGRPACVQQNIDLWSLDLERRHLHTADVRSGIDSLPLWSPDGRRIVFNSPRNSEAQLSVKRVDGTVLTKLWNSIWRHREDCVRLVSRRSVSFCTNNSMKRRSRRTYGYCRSRETASPTFSICTHTL